MIDTLATALKPSFLDRLHEYTAAKSRQAFLHPNEVTPKAYQRLVGHARQDALQEAFRMSAAAEGLEVVDFSPQMGMPSRYVVSFETFNMTVVGSRVHRPALRWECKALAMIANERFAIGAEVVDLFTGTRIIHGTKPLISWIAVWNSARRSTDALPEWTGFRQIEAIDERHIRFAGQGVGYAAVKAAVLDKAKPAKKPARQKFTPKALPSAKSNEKDKD